MTPGLLVAAATVLTVVALLLLVALLTRATRRRRRLEDSLAAAREELSTVQRRLDTLARHAEPRSVTQDTEYVITTAGEPDRDEAVAPSAPAVPVSGRQFASMAVGESLVTILSLGYGVRRALSAQNRNRIGFEMRRAVRTARKQRRREEKQARRHLREAAEQDAA